MNMKKLNTYIPEKMLSALKSRKDATGIPVAEFVRRAIEVALAEDAQKDRVRKLRSGK